MKRLLILLILCGYSKWSAAQEVLPNLAETSNAALSETTTTAKTTDETSAATNAEQTTDATENPVNEPESAQNTLPNQAVEAPQQVFSPQFMQSLRQCRSDSEQNDTVSAQIIGPKDDKCQVKYAGFDLAIPLTVASNIHSFDDLHLLLKNPDIATPDYQPEYIYDGLIYAIDACYHHTDYFGLKQQQSTDNYIASRGLEAEFYNDLCTIRLQNELNINGAITDYSVICRLTPKNLAILEDRLSELLQKYGAKRGFSDDGRAITLPAQQNEETHQGDIAVMFLLQQEGYCQKMHDD